jgi:hypothetical protein
MNASKYNMNASKYNMNASKYNMNASKYNMNSSKYNTSIDFHRFSQGVSKEFPTLKTERVDQQVTISKSTHGKMAEYIDHLRTYTSILMRSYILVLDRQCDHIVLLSLTCDSYQ